MEWTELIKALIAFAIPVVACCWKWCSSEMKTQKAEEANDEITYELEAGVQPTVTVTATGDDTSKVFNFEFGIPRGGDAAYVLSEKALIEKEKKEKQLPTNCPNCGAPIDSRLHRCAYCGTEYRESEHNTQREQHSIAVRYFDAENKCWVWRQESV